MAERGMASGLKICEIFSPPRITREAPRFGLQPRVELPGRQVPQRDVGSPGDSAAGCGSFES